MEPEDNRDPQHTILSAYLKGFAPPAGSRQRVWDGVQECEPSRRRWRPGYLLVAVPAFAAAAVLTMWCSGSSAPMYAELSDAHEAAMYEGRRDSEQQAAALRRRGRRPGSKGARSRDVASVEAASVEPEPEQEPKPEAGELDPASTRLPESRRVTPKRPAPATSAPRISGLIAQLRKIEHSLRSKQPKAALARLERYRGRLMSAGLTEELDSHELLARCQLGQDAKVMRARFVARYPQSLYHARISTACTSKNR